LRVRAEAKAKVRATALRRLAAAAQVCAGQLKLTRWIVPMYRVAITAELGQYGLWSSYHTGVDFNGETATPSRRSPQGL
jgi:hypothetical protein